MPDRRLFDTVDLFQELPPDVIERLRDRAVTQHYPRGAALFEQGDPSSALYVVTEGRVAIVTHAADDRETVVAVMETGGLFGELGLFDDEPRSSGTRALTDSIVVSVSYGDVRAVLEEQPQLLWIVTRILAQRLRATDEALSDAVFLDVPARTAKRLLELAGDAHEVTLPMTQEELASLIGASRERVNKALAMFTRLGWVDTVGRSHYRIVDRDALALRAGL